MYAFIDSRDAPVQRVASDVLERFQNHSAGSQPSYSLDTNPTRFPSESVMTAK